MMTSHLVADTLLFQLFLPEFSGGEFVWMRLRWWRVMLVLQQKWLCDYMLNIVGA
jgi:hypothetical protein